MQVQLGVEELHDVRFRLQAEEAGRVNRHLPHPVGHHRLVHRLEIDLNRDHHVIRRDSHRTADQAHAHARAAHRNTRLGQRQLQRDKGQRISAQLEGDLHVRRHAGLPHRRQTHLRLAADDGHHLRVPFETDVLHHAHAGAKGVKAKGLLEVGRCACQRMVVAEEEDAVGPAHRHRPHVVLDGDVRQLPGSDHLIGAAVALPRVTGIADVEATGRGAADRMVAAFRRTPFQVRFAGRTYHPFQFLHRRPHLGRLGAAHIQGVELYDLGHAAVGDRVHRLQPAGIPSRADVDLQAGQIHEAVLSVEGRRLRALRRIPVTGRGQRVQFPFYLPGDRHRV